MYMHDSVSDLECRSQTLGQNNFACLLHVLVAKIAPAIRHFGNGFSAMFFSFAWQRL